MDRTIVKKGFVKIKGKIPIGRSWKKKLLVLYGPSSNGPARIVRYNSEQAFEDEDPSSEIPLKDVGSALRCKMMEGADSDGITLQMTDRSIKQFLCESEAESTEWLLAIQAELRKSDILPDDMFRVFLLPSLTLNDSGECILEVTSDQVLIFDNDSKSRLITSCDITHIRRYGADAKKKQFLIEVGSQNPTGEAIYLFRTIYYDGIHRRLDASAQRIKSKSTSRNVQPVSPVQRSSSKHQYANVP